MFPILLFRYLVALCKGGNLTEARPGRVREGWRVVRDGVDFFVVV